MVGVSPIVLLSGGNGDRQTILFGRKRTGGVRRDRAGRIVGAVEIDDHSPIQNRIALQETPSRVGVGFAGQIVDNEREPLRRITTQRRQPYFLAIDLEYNGPGHWGVVWCRLKRWARPPFSFHRRVSS